MFLWAEVHPPRAVRGAGRAASRRYLTANDTLSWIDGSSRSCWRHGSALWGLQLRILESSSSEMKRRKDREKGESRTAESPELRFRISLWPRFLRRSECTDVRRRTLECRKGERQETGWFDEKFRLRIPTCIRVLLYHLGREV